MSTVTEKIGTESFPSKTDEERAHATELAISSIKVPSINDNDDDDDDHDGSSPDEESDLIVDEKERRLAINRENARSCRKRKKLMVQNLRHDVITLSEENQTLRSQNDELRKEVERLKSMFLDHIQRPTVPGTSLDPRTIDPRSIDPRNPIGGGGNVHELLLQQQLLQQRLVALESIQSQNQGVNSDSLFTHSNSGPSSSRLQNFNTNPLPQSSILPQLPDMNGINQANNPALFSIYANLFNNQGPNSNGVGR